jgi:hypothetical protein
MSLGHGASVVRDGLVLHLDAANVKSYPGTGTVWNDLSGNSNNGTLVNGPTYSSDNKGGFVLDGVNDYVDYSIANPYAETITVWAKSNTPNWNNYGWLSSSRKVNGHILHPTINTKAVAFYVYNSASAFTLMGNITVADITIPHMYSYTTNGSNSHKVYLDGVLVLTSTTAITRSLTPPIVSTKFGSDDLGGRYGNGNLYSTIRYNRELSEVEIKQNFEALRGRYGI